MKQKTDSTQVRQSKISEIFTLVKNENGKVFIAVGQYRAHKREFDTFEQADKYLGTKPYEIIVNLIGLAIYEKEQSKKTTKRSKKTTESTAEDKETAK